MSLKSGWSNEQFKIVLHLIIEYLLQHIKLILFLRECNWRYSNLFEECNQSIFNILKFYAVENKARRLLANFTFCNCRMRMLRLMQWWQCLTISSTCALFLVVLRKLLLIIDWVIKYIFQHRIGTLRRLTHLKPIGDEIGGFNNVG